MPTFGTLVFNMLKLSMPDFKKLEKRIEDIKRSKVGGGVEIGVIKNSIGYDRRNNKKKKITVAEEAFYNSKGVPERNIPPRDYQKRVIDENMKQWRKVIRKGLKTSKTSVLLNKLGIDARDKTKAVISHFGEPRNAPSTVKVKGRNSPLVDFGDLLKSITYKVVGQKNEFT